MQLERKILDPRGQRGEVAVRGEAFACRMRTDWASFQREPNPTEVEVAGKPLRPLRFGLDGPGSHAMDLHARSTDAGVVVTSQGYREIRGGRVPFLRTRRFFWARPEMLHERHEVWHLGEPTYHLSYMGMGAFDVSADGRAVTLERFGAAICFQFDPAPKLVRGKQALELVFDSRTIDVLVTWGEAGALPRYVLEALSEAEVRPSAASGAGERPLPERSKERALEPGERLVLPAGETMLDGDAGEDETGRALEPGLWDLGVRRLEGATARLGAGRVFHLPRLAESASDERVKPFLVRTLRSLKERSVFGVVPEDDPEQPYKWGFATWPRCFTVTALDAFGLTREAFAFLEFMLDVSRQFVWSDGQAHLWGNFWLHGPASNNDSFDVNGHAIKLYEAGKLYLHHRADEWGEALRTRHYETLRAWCAWIEAHVDEDDLVFDKTESNVWAYGQGAFTQTPAAAGAQLFLTLARDAGREEDAARFADLVDRLMNGLHGKLFDDARNHFLGIEAEAGRCYQTALWEDPDAEANEPEANGRVGLSCYSLAPHFFLQDPDVGLLAADDARAVETLDLALARLGDAFDERVVTWHVRARDGHMGYGQGQLLMALAHAGRAEALQQRLAALFEVSARELGDPYLMQEVVGRAGDPNRGNKAHCPYYPMVIAQLAGLTPPGPVRDDLVPGLRRVE